VSRLVAAGTHEGQEIAMLDAARHTVRDVARRLGRSGGFTAAVVLTLGVAIGATTAVFSVVNSVILNPLPYRSPDALVRIAHRIGGVVQPYFSDAIYLAYVDHARTFADLGVWVPGETAAITGLGEPEQVRVLTASRGVLTTLAVAPDLGRWFSAAEDSPAGPDAVLLGHGYWQRRFGGDRAAIERALVVDGRPHQIVGVMPADFSFGGEFEIVRPLRVDPAAPIPSFRLLGVARLTAGVLPVEADADAASVLHAWFEQSGTRPAIRARWAPALQPLAQDVIGDAGRALWLLFGAIGVVLLLACANVVNLLLVRAEARRQELAVRAALGASWQRLSGQLLTEGLGLSLAAGAIGIGLAHLGIRALVAAGPANLPRLHEITIDARALAFALALAMTAGLLFGVIALVGHVGPRLADALGGRGASPGREQLRWQQVLVAGQIALALLLLVCAGLMSRSFLALRAVDPGFTAADRVQTFSLAIPATAIADPERVARVQHDIVERLAAIPGVTSVAFTTRVPMGSDRSSAALVVEGRADDGTTPANRQIKVVSPDLFRTQGTRLLAGRDFTWTDVHAGRHVAIVSENLAQELWGSPAAALGRRVREYYVADSPWWEVIGVAADVHDDGPDRPAPATVYWPALPKDELQSMDGYQSRRVSMAMRSERAGTAALMAQVGAAVWAVNATLPLAQVRTLDEVYAASMARTAFTLMLLAIAGAMALLLSVSGLYGVIAYASSRRRREIGIRLTLGATASRIRWLFLRRGLLVVFAGIALGVVGAVAVTDTLQALLYGVRPLDPIAFVAAPLILAAVAVVAADLPARRAAAVDPAETLRTE
jgi:predicted permease